MSAGLDNLGELGIGLWLACLFVLGELSDQKIVKIAQMSTEPCDLPSTG